jgi:hypothetical protein
LRAKGERKELRAVRLPPHRTRVIGGQDLQSRFQYRMTRKNAAHHRSPSPYVSDGESAAVSIEVH